LPAEQARLYDTIRKTGAGGVIFLSGDRVSAGLYRLPERLPYPAFEATSSALNLPLKEITGKDGNDEVSTGQPGALYADPNFGRVNIDWRGRSVTLEIRSVDGRVVRRTTIPFGQLRAQ
jgi:alkaline phosphatase D